MSHIGGVVFYSDDLMSGLSSILSVITTFQLHYLRLPKDISEDYVILMDCTVSTGAAAMMAVRVLLVGRASALGNPPSVHLWYFYLFIYLF